MATPRNGGYTTTLLPDGKVLLAGGAGAPALPPVGSSVASAELYDPATKSFTPTGDMTMGRWRHAPTLLLSGKVLIAGGYSENAGRPTDPARISAELYDPSTGIFTPTGNMAGPGGAAATLLASGKI